MNKYTHGIVERMHHPVDSVLQVSQRLQELRERMIALDTERDAIQRQIDDCLNELSSTIDGQRVPPPDGTLSQNVLLILQQNRNRPLAPIDVAEILGLRSRRELTNVRVLMSRMARDGRIDRVSRARYLPRGAGR